jgi:hypothetical protein
VSKRKIPNIYKVAYFAQTWLPPHKDYRPIVRNNHFKDTNPTLVGTNTFDRKIGVDIVRPRKLRVSPNITVGRVENSPPFAQDPNRGM